MLVYCPKLSSRTIYILELLLGKTMGISYSVTNVVDEFEHHEGPRLNYSSKAFGAEPFLEASELLFEDQVIDQSEALGQHWRHPGGLRVAG